MTDTWQVRNEGVFVPSSFPEKLTLVSSEKWVSEVLKLRFLVFGLIQGKKNLEISSNSSYF